MNAAVENAPSAQTVRASDEPYGCKDRVYSPGYYAPSRVALPDGNFKLTTKYLLHKMSVGCMYDRSHIDKRCEGCCHRKETLQCSTG